ncbi:MAG: glycosyltransferase [Candidatus Sumerlaeaceae bacterium]|nr:glycosyltransferase [Candidatus Sumerlaeaceae bacterium]
MAEMPTVSVVIVNYETSAMVRRCVASLRQQDPVPEIIVVDNPSAANDAANLDDLGVKVVRNPENIGYGLACNSGAAAGTGRFVCILNPDTELPGGTLAAWVEVFQQVPDAGLIAPRLLNDNGTPQRSAYHFIGPLTYWVYHSIFAGLMKRFRKSVALGSDSSGAIQRADWVMGAAMLIPRDVWEQIGGFSDQYFLYSEDTDLCWRIHEAGYEVYLAPWVSIIHTQGEPSVQNRDTSIGRYYDGFQTFLKLRYPPWRRHLVEISIILDMLIRIPIFSVAAILRPKAVIHRRRLRGYVAAMGQFVRSLFS